MLDGPQGQGMARALGRPQDVEQALLTDAVLMRYPARCPADALPFLGADSNIERFPGEPDGTANPPTGYHGRLMARWETWKKAGSAQGVIASLRAYGFTDVQLVQDFEAHYFQGDWYSRFQVIVGPDFGALAFAPLVAPFTTDAEGSTTGGSTATISQVRAVKRQILKWKAVHSYPVRIILRFGDVVLGNINSTPPFTPPDPSLVCRWDLGKLAVENINTAPFTPNQYEV